MAKTWTVAEAYNAMKEGNKDAIADFGKRFPLATTALAQAGVNVGLDAFLNALPDRVTMRVVEMSLKEGVQPIEDDEEEAVVVEEKPVKEEKKSKATKEEKAPAKKGKKKAEPVVEEEDETEEIEEEEIADDAVDYSSMNAVELFKECKKRKLKVEPKQKASVYIKALEADDKAKSAEADDADDWDEEEEEKPVKKSGKATKATKKSKADDDDDEWDI